MFGREGRLNYWPVMRLMSCSGLPSERVDPYEINRNARSLIDLGMSWRLMCDRGRLSRKGACQLWRSSRVGILS